MKHPVSSRPSLAFLLSLAVCFATGCALVASSAFAAGPLAVSSTGASVDFAALAANGSLVVSVASPDGTVTELSSDSGALSYSLFDAEGSLRPDGFYHWQALLLPTLSDAQREALAAARERGDDRAPASARIPDSYKMSGSFAVSAGSLVVDDGTVVEAVKVASSSAGAPSAEDTAIDLPFKAQVFTTDLIVQGSGCIGFDCSTTESFGSDTFRLKENNLRIHFDDTSSSASFPSRDWRLVANDTSNGGAEYFSIQDSTANRTPFRLDGNAPNNALRLTEAGNFGIGTATPAIKLQVTDGNSPSLRLEQDGSDGFQSQTWDLSGNETNFFIRDVTNSSKLPFRIRPGAPDSSIYITAAGDVSLNANNGTSADASLHVERTGADEAASLLVESNASDASMKTLAAAGTSVISAEGLNASVQVKTTESSTSARDVFLGETNGPPRFSISNTANSAKWFVGQNSTGSLTISKNGTPSNEFRLNGLDESNPGRATFQADVRATSFDTTSDRNKKMAFRAVDVAAVLAKVVEMPVSSWQFIADPEARRHIGPMAQDFHAAFGLGTDDKHIATVDADGVALAAIQALHRDNQEKAAEIDELKERLAALEALVLDR